MKPRVKVCGITNLKDALFCLAAGADALGFIFYEMSKRYAEPRRAAEIIKNLPHGVTTVGVFVNAPRESIERTLAVTGITTIQMSGDESPADCIGYPVDVWKSFRIREKLDIDAIRSYQVAKLMLDGASDGKYGGSGELPDFSVAIEMQRIRPLYLAGGLNPDNVLEAIRAVAPYGIDVNSGVELSPGKKDHEKVHALFEALTAI